MANTLTYFLDPATLTQQAIAGKAQLIPDQTASMWGQGAGNGIFNGLNYMHGFEKIDTTASTISLAVYRTKLVVSGTMAVTLPNGLFDGQKKLIRCESAASTPVLTLTITTAETQAGYVTAPSVQFDTAGQAVEYEWTSSVASATGAWRAIRVWRAGSLSVVVGTTVLTTNVLTQCYQLSVTSTVASTSGGKGIPNGQVSGEVIHISTPTAASIPSGSISVAGTTIATAAAATTLGGVNATTAQASFIWDTTNSWQCTALTTATFS